uniref:Uncharacterized protein n=1 Tax=Arion vulgaris TaxID=1028688 RepID=A0A0B7C044_9EUPU
MTADGDVGRAFIFSLCHLFSFIYVHYHILVITYQLESAMNWGGSKSKEEKHHYI